MATPCNLAPFISQEFYITGWWGEPRGTHLHAGLDLATGGINNVYNMKEGVVRYQDPNGTDGSGYRAIYNNTKFRWYNLAIWRFITFYSIYYWSNNSTGTIFSKRGKSSRNRIYWLSRTC